MASIGYRNALRIVREATPGYYLDGEDLGEILLPRRYMTEESGPGDYVVVFVHRDSEDRLVATTEIPDACVDEFAWLKVVSASPQMGAFLDWGLTKDLLLPIREQAKRVRVGDAVIAYIFLDEHTGRIVATTRLDGHLDRTPPRYEEGQKVALLIAGETPLGYKAIVENAHWGLLFKSDLGAPLSVGQKMEGYVRALRPDGKIDLSLDLAGYQRVQPLTDLILETLAQSGGRLPFGDRSTPEEIRTTFGTSKKAFKQALGALYRQRRVRLTEGEIEIVETNEPPVR